MDKTQELFVIGNPRSGTSLLRIMLNSHSSVVIPPECGFIQWWYNKYQSWSPQSSVSEFVSDLKTSKKIETWRMDFEALEFFLKSKSISNYNELVFNVIAFYGQSLHQKNDPQILGDKNNYYIDHLNTLKEISPMSKFLIIIRDPKDVYCSYKGIAELNSKSSYVPKLPQQVEEFIANWNNNQSEIFQFLSHLHPNQFAIVTYEDLVLKSEPVLRKICDFLELIFEEKMLHYYKTNDEPIALLEWKKKTLRPPDPSSIGVFKHRLTSVEIEAIEHGTSEVYNQFKSVIN